MLVTMTPEEVLQCYLTAYRFASEPQRFFNHTNQSLPGNSLGQLPVIPQTSLQHISNFTTSCNPQKFSDFSIATLMSSPSTSSLKQDQLSPSSTASSSSFSRSPNESNSSRKNTKSKSFPLTNGRPVRCVVNSETAKPLDVWLKAHLHDPYPTDQEVDQFMKETGFEKQQIRGWFTNHRRRIAKEYATRGEKLPWEKKPGPIRPSRHSTP